MGRRHEQQCVVPGSIEPHQDFSKGCPETSDTRLFTIRKGWLHQDILRREDQISVTFIIVYCYNWSILLLVTIVSFLRSLTYKVNGIIGMHAEGWALSMVSGRQWGPWNVYH